MQQNQKYFPLLDSHGKLLNKFLIVSNMAVADPHHIVEGNARVVRPRLSDARFFFNQDRKTTLASRLEKLAHVVYHNKLGTQLQRIERLEVLAQKIAVRLQANGSLAARAARLAKADLVTDMVGEFPELQGIMGRYYALHDGEDTEVAEAIYAHYQPRFAGDALPQGNVAAAVALADKLDALCGFFGIGQLPTGDKDPFALRRAALGVLRILIETPLPLRLDELIADAASGFTPGHSASKLDAGFAGLLFDFFMDRLRGYLRDAGHAPEAIEAVLVQRPTRVDLVPAKLDAVRAFALLPESQALAAANKRIGNILKKSDGEGKSLGRPELALLAEPAEQALFERVVLLAPQIESFVANHDYADALKALAGVRAEVDRFFDEVMVMAEEPLVRTNRLALLAALSAQLNAVADISRLSA
jgi:glycyl-tRNA synthetase beta chain